MRAKRRLVTVFSVLATGVIVAPFIAKFFVNVPDTKIWLTNPAPAGFLRWEGPIVLPTDPIVSR
jgi:hypothetical protein